jgi:hypothetical protein
MITFEVITFTGAALIGAGLMVFVLAIALAVAFLMDNEEK